MENEKTNELIYEKKGQAGVVGAVITLAVGLSVVTLIYIFTGVLGGQTYQISESKIDAITNTTIKGYIKDSIVAGFSAQKQNAEFLPIIGLAMVTALVMGLVLGFAGGGMTGGSRSAL